MACAACHRRAFRRDHGAPSAAGHARPDSKTGPIGQGTGSTDRTGGRQLHRIRQPRHLRHPGRTSSRSESVARRTGRARAGPVDQRHNAFRVCEFACEPADGICPPSAKTKSERRGGAGDLGNRSVLARCARLIRSGRRFPVRAVFDRRLHVRASRFPPSNLRHPAGSGARRLLRAHVRYAGHARMAELCATGG